MEDFARMFDGPTVGKRESGEQALWLVPANGATLLPSRLLTRLAFELPGLFDWLTNRSGSF